MKQFLMFSVIINPHKKPFNIIEAFSKFSKLEEKTKSLKRLKKLKRQKSKKVEKRKTLYKSFSSEKKESH